MVKNNDRIQQFLDSTHEEVEKSGERCSLLTFNGFWDKKYGAAESDFDRRAFLNDVSSLMASNQISYYQEITSYRKGIAPAVFFFKRVIRKFNAFLFLPLVAAQNAINMSFARFAGHVRSYINREENLKLQILRREKELEAQIEKQDEKIKELSLTVKELSEQISRLTTGGSEQ